MWSGSPGPSLGVRGGCTMNTISKILNSVPYSDNKTCYFDLTFCLRAAAAAVAGLEAGALEGLAD